MKDLKISAELASAVLGKEVTKCSLINKSRNSINITYFEDKEDFNPMCKEWNIYEFTFKCIEWLIDVTDNSVEIITNKDDTYVRIYIPNEADFYSEYATDKIEAIIKVCEWYIKRQNEL